MVAILFGQSQGTPFATELFVRKAFDETSTMSGKTDAPGMCAVLFIIDARDAVQGLTGAIIRFDGVILTN